MNDNRKIAELLFPHITTTPEDMEAKYPERNLPEDAMVTRFAPSPTGFVHFGGLFVSMINQWLANQSNGVFFLRIEDTDKKREVEGGVENIIRSLAGFDVLFDEGVTGMDSEKGNYGPYKQSERAEIYQTFVKHLIEQGMAYPCFCSEEELNAIRAVQEEKKITPGYHGEWAVHRNASLDQVMAELDSKKPYVIRLKSPGSPEKRFVLKDMVKGDIEMPENDQDIVILKSDGLPTYHFAHAVDDHLMRTTHVVRGDEWLSSAPIHVQLFDVLGWHAPKFCHISPIMKLEGSSKRKLSKRKDPEAAVTYYHEEGYPTVTVIEYILNLINSTFEEWRRDNPGTPNTEFKIAFDKMSVSGSLFDIIKLTDISKELVSRMTADQVYDLSLEWAKQYDHELADWMEGNEAYVRRIFAIDRYIEKPRKDFAKWSDVKPAIRYFFDAPFEEEIKDGYTFPENMPNEDVKNIIKAYMTVYNSGDTKDGWLDRVRNFCESMGYARDPKSFKKNPQDFKGHIGDVTGIIRIAVSNRKNTPDLYEMMQVMGLERVMKRFQQVLDNL